MSAQQELIAHHSDQEQVKNHVNAELQLRQQLEDTQEQLTSRVQELEAQKKVNDELRVKVTGLQNDIEKAREGADRSIRLAIQLMETINKPTAKVTPLKGIPIIPEVAELPAAEKCSVINLHLIDAAKQVKALHQKVALLKAERDSMSKDLDFSENDATRVVSDYEAEVSRLKSELSAALELLADKNKLLGAVDKKVKQDLVTSAESDAKRMVGAQKRRQLESEHKETIEALKGKVAATESTVRTLASKLTATENTVKNIGRKNRLLTGQNTALKKQADALSREVEADTQRFASLEYATTGERSERPDKQFVKELTKYHVHDGRLAKSDLAYLREQVDGKEEELHVKLKENADLGWENAALANDIQRQLKESSKKQDELDKALEAQSDLQFQVDELTVEMEELRRYPVAKSDPEGAFTDPNGDAWSRPEQVPSANNAGLLTVKH